MSLTTPVPSTVMSSARHPPDEAAIRSRLQRLQIGTMVEFSLSARNNVVSHSKCNIITLEVGRVRKQIINK
ncbi:hypothetical protein [Xenorhabdus bovienii]|uniref:hypothetical protein n=1 Tax=Xenorhabdus bovienii TaxID=40576 RepID=UPI003DA5FC5C